MNTEKGKLEKIAINLAQETLRDYDYINIVEEYEEELGEDACLEIHNIINRKLHVSLEES